MYVRRTEPETEVRLTRHDVDSEDHSVRTLYTIQ